MAKSSQFSHALILCLLPVITFADVNRLFVHYGKVYGIDPVLLKVIANNESALNPYAMNINKESIHECTSKTEALKGLKYTITHPYVVHVKQGTASRVKSIPEYKLNCVFKQRGKKSFDRLWFSSEEKAVNFTHRYPRSVIKQVRKVKVSSTDIGYAQINWKHHGEHFDSVRELFDPVTNLGYQSRYLHRLIQRYGSWKKAVGYYNSSTDKYRIPYMKRIISDYYKVKNNSLVVTNND